MIQTFSNKGLIAISEPPLQENLQACEAKHVNEIPSELFEVVSVWEKLPEHVRQTIRMLVETAGKKSGSLNDLGEM